MSATHAPMAPTHPVELVDDDTAPHFAFANVRGDVCLVQVSATPTSPLVASDIRVFRHEFITIFRYSHSASVHPSDIRVLEDVPALGAVYEEEKGTVFLAREVMERMQKLVAAARPAVGMGMGMGAKRYQQVPRSARTRMTMARVH